MSFSNLLAAKIPGNGFSFAHTHTYAAQTNWTIILGVEQRPCLADIYSFFLTPNDVVKVNGATSLRGFRTSQCLKILKMASEGQYFIIKFWFQAWNISGTQKVSGAATRCSQLLWWFQRAYVEKWEILFEWFKPQWCAVKKFFQGFQIYIHWPEALLAFSCNLHKSQRLIASSQENKVEDEDASVKRF